MNYILYVNAMAESIKKVAKQSKTVLNNPDLHENQVTVIQSKMEELENQFQGPTEPDQEEAGVAGGLSLLLPAYPSTGADISNYHAGLCHHFLAGL
jgi:hypothetical protein